MTFIKLWFLNFYLRELFKQNNNQNVVHLQLFCLVCVEQKHFLCIFNSLEIFKIWDKLTALFIHHN